MYFTNELSRIPGSFPSPFRARKLGNRRTTILPPTQMDPWSWSISFCPFTFGVVVVVMVVMGLHLPPKVLLVCNEVFEPIDETLILFFFTYLFHFAKNSNVHLFFFLFFFSNPSQKFFFFPAGPVILFSCFDWIFYPRCIIIISKLSRSSILN